MLTSHSHHPPSHQPQLPIPEPPQRDYWRPYSVPAFLISIRDNWTLSGYYVYFAAAFLSYPKDWLLTRPCRDVAKAASVGLGTVSRHFSYLRNTDLLEHIGKDGRTDVYQLVDLHDRSRLHDPVLESYPEAASLIYNRGKIHQSVIDRAHRERWTLEKLRTYLACCMFASYDNGEFWASKRKIASLAHNSLSGVHKHIADFLTQRFIIQNDSHSKPRALIIAAYQTQSMNAPPAASDGRLDPEIGKTWNDDLPSGHSLPLHDPQTRMNIVEQPQTHATSELRPPNYPKCRSHRSTAPESWSTPQPASDGRLDPEIGKMPNDRTRGLNSSRSDPVDLPSPVIHTGGSTENSQPAAAEDLEGARHQQTAGSLPSPPSPRNANGNNLPRPASSGESPLHPVQMEWNQMYAEVSQNAHNHIDAAFNTVLRMFNHRRDKCGTEYKICRSYEAVANAVAPYLDSEHGWKLFARADEKDPANYLGWIRTVAPQGGPWSRTKSREPLPDDQRALRLLIKDRHFHNKLLRRDPQNTAYLTRIQQIDAALADYAAKEYTDKLTAIWDGTYSPSEPRIPVTDCPVDPDLYPPDSIDTFIVYTQMVAAYLRREKGWTEDEYRDALKSGALGSLAAALAARDDLWNAVTRSESGESYLDTAENYLYLPDPEPQPAA